MSLGWKQSIFTCLTNKCEHNFQTLSINRALHQDSVGPSTTLWPLMDSHEGVDPKLHLKQLLHQWWQRQRWCGTDCRVVGLWTRPETGKGWQEGEVHCWKFGISVERPTLSSSRAAFLYLPLLIPPQRKDNVKKKKRTCSRDISGEGQLTWLVPHSLEEKIILKCTSTLCRPERLQLWS